MGIVRGPNHPSEVSAMAAKTRKPRPQPLSPAAPAAPAPEAPPRQEASAPIAQPEPRLAPVYIGDWLAFLFWVGCALVLAVLLLQDLILSLLGL
jgi:hypothetical protein